MHTWTYDGIGNRTSAAVNGTPTSYTYFKNGSNPLNGQRLQSDGVSAYTYDANGNTLTRTGTPGSFTFGWDAQDRLTSIAGSATATYTYDYQGRRTSTTTGGATTTYLYDGLNLVRTSGASQAEYLFGPGIDEPLAMRRGGVVYHYSVDGLGSVALVTNQGGTTVHDAYLYDAWGVLRRQTGTLANDFGYTAREFAEAGLWYYRARYYQPGIGRFGSEDPIGLRGGPSLYTYVRGNPVTWTDPTGRLPERPFPPNTPWGTSPVWTLCGMPWVVGLTPLEAVEHGYPPGKKQNWKLLFWDGYPVEAPPRLKRNMKIAFDALCARRGAEMGVVTKVAEEGHTYDSPWSDDFWRGFKPVFEFRACCYLCPGES